jgi:glycosyl-4,4'-diaponeurosporenoate acyltransferase
VALVELTPGWAVLVDCIVWAVVGVAAGYVASRWPASRLTRDGAITRLRHFEQDGRWYERRWHIRSWKHLLPEAGSFFAGGFSKRALVSRQTGHLQRFVIETRRAELTHWAVLSVGPLFFLWNPWWLAVVMVVYAICANVPCIVVQRYNRARLQRLLVSRERRSRATRGSA